MRAKVSELLSGIYLHKHQNTLITGPTGTGKIFVACAIAEQSCERQYTVRYYRLSRLLDDLRSGKLDGSCQKQLFLINSKVIGHHENT
jgi:DNA replication protein DnaC